MSGFLHRSMKKYGEFVQKFRINCLVFIFFFIISLVVFRGLLSKPGTVGHHWDWSIPPTGSYLVNMAKLYLWNPQFLGFSIGYGASALPFTFILGCAAFLGLSGDFVSKSLLIVSVVVSGCSMYWLVKDILSSEFTKPKIDERSRVVTELSSLTAGYYYALSPFLFNEFIGGACTQFVTYSFAPLVFLFYRRALVNNSIKWKYILLTAFSFSVIAVSLQKIVLLLGIMFLYIFLRGKKQLFALLTILAIWAPLNAYWILFLLSQKGQIIADAIKAKPIEAILYNIKVHAPSLLKAFLTTGYWEDFFLKAIPPPLLFSWALATCIVIAIMFSTLILHPKNRQVLFWSSLALTSLIIITGRNAPLGGLVQWVYVNIPLMILFSSPQHLIFLYTFSYATFLGLASSVLSAHFNKKSIIVIGLILTILTSIWVAPFYTGNLGGNVDTFQLPSDYERINKIMSENGGKNYRVLYLPMAGSPLYKSTEYQSANQGGDPMIIYSIQRAVIADLVPNYYAKQFANLSEILLCDKNPPKHVAKLLGLASVKYIILRKDVSPNFGPFNPTSGRWNYSRVYENLIYIDGIELVREYDYASLWKNCYVCPHIYTVTDVILINGSLNEMAQVACSDNFTVGISALFLSNQLSPLDWRFIKKYGLTNYNSSPSIKFEEINPTNYIIHVNASKPFFLIFSESYHKDWTAYIDNWQILDEHHFIANGYANVWYINKIGSYDIILEFWPQRVFYVGTTMSLITFIACILYLSKDWLRSFYNRYKMMQKKMCLHHKDL